MALTEKNQFLIMTKVPNRETRLKLMNAVDKGNIDSNVLQEILNIYEGYEMMPQHNHGQYGTDYE